MTKLPMESRPLRLAPEVQKVVEQKLQPLSGKKLEVAQDAVLKVYQSGKQQDGQSWVKDYGDAIDTALEK